MFNGKRGVSRGGDNRKAKNFGASIRRLVSEMKGFYAPLIIAVLMAIAGSVLSVIAPNKLALITDEITMGLTIDKDVAQNVAEQIIHEPYTDSVINETLVTADDKAVFIEKFNNISTEAMNEESVKKIYATIDELPDSIRGLIEPKMNYDVIKGLALGMALLYVISALLTFFEGWIMAGVTAGFARNLRNRISRKINRLPLSYFDKHQIGDVLSRITNDVDSVASSLDNSFGSIVSEGSLLIGATVMMFYTNAILAIVAIASSLFGFIFVALVLSKSQKYFTERQIELGKINAHIEEVYSGLMVVKAYDGKASADRKFDAINKKIYVANQKSQFLSGLMHPFMAFVGNFGYVAVCVTGALLTANGAISFGVIVAFILYVRLFSSPLSRIAQAIGGLQPAVASSERVFEFIDEIGMKNEEDLHEQLDRDTVCGDIEFNHVKFGYDDDKLIIKDFSAKIKAGQKIAIVGPTGAGKTTIVNLLMKFYEIKSGDIKIDGKSTKEMSRKEIHSLFTMVLQDTWLFSGTIRDNIAYNHAGISDEEIMAICDKVGLSHFIKTLPYGLKTDISESESVSAGQKQLITIARGMVEDAPFLILDEATSNVDTRTEELVQKAMDKLMEGRTSFIIAHRLSTIRNADLILVMDNGNIVESGNHNELMAKDGFYAKLYNSQFAL